VSLFLSGLITFRVRLGYLNLAKTPLHIGFIVDGPAQIESTLQECNRLGVKVAIGPRDRKDVKRASDLLS
jgi:hypothetical protein